MKIVVTGGHTSPALAFAEEVIHKKSSYRVLWFGRKYALDSDTKPSFEFYEVSKLSIPFIDIPSGKLIRAIHIKTIIHICRFIKGVYIASKNLLKEKPDFVISFGGYIGMTVVVACWFTRTYYYIHEQTLAPGIANRISAWFAKKVFVGFRESASFFPIRKVHIIGNPLRREILHAIECKKKRTGKIKPLLFITGGTIGSHSINTLILPIIRHLTKKFTIVHQCGSSAEYDDYTRLSQFESESYRVFKHLSSEEIAQIYTDADMVISRSGANTTTELLSLRIPSILIPLPWSASGEQEKHAKYLERIGIAVIFHQPAVIDKTSSYSLLEKIIKMYEQVDRYQTLTISRSIIHIHTHAAEQLVQAVISQ